MVEFLKKYRLNILVLLLLTGLLLFFIPNEEEHYLQPDIDEVKNKSHSVLLWAGIILFTVLFLFGLRHLKKMIDLFYLVSGLGLLALTFFFFFDSIFLSATFFLNRLSKNSTVDKTYSVVYISQNKKSLLLWDNELKTVVQADQLINQAGKQNIHIADAVDVSFTKGLLGFKFDPTITAIRNTAANSKVLSQPAEE